MRVGKLFGLILFAVASVAPNLVAQTLEQRWEFEKSTGFRRTDQAQLLKGKHVLFVAGVMNELADIISNYYPDNIEAAAELGATTSYFGPSSQKSIPKNAEILYRKILEVHRNINKPLIVFGHSKGGAEALHTILDHPELILEGKVEQVLLIQPAIGGSPLAAERSWGISGISAILNPNLETLSPKTAKQNFDKVFREFDAKVSRAARNIISDRIFYVRSQESPLHLSFGIELVLGVLQGDLNDYGPNDGLLLVEAQMDPRIGIDLGILRSDHIGLTVGTVSNISKRDRKAFTRALFESVVNDF